MCASQLSATNKEQLAKANCSVLQGGTRRKSDVIYSIDGILDFIHERLYSEI